MANFTNTEIKDTYQRVLQIDGGVIQNGLGQTVNASITSLTGSFSGSLEGTASYALTASHALNAGSTFPFTGDAQITGSLHISGSPEPLKIVNSSNNMYMQVNNISQLNASKALRLKAQGDAFGTGVILEADTSNIEIGADTSGKKIFMHSPTVEITSSLTVTGSAVITGSLNTSGIITSTTSSHDYIQSSVPTEPIKLDGKDGGESLHYADGGDTSFLEISDGITLDIASETTKLSLDSSGIEFKGSINTAITASSNISSSGYISASSFSGDGSGLTNLPSSSTFPFTGDAQITGSLTISGSFSSFTLDSSNVVLGAGSGVSMEAGADSNIIIGTTTAASLTTGDFNIILGDNAGGAMTTGQKNVLLGQRAGGNSTSLNENVFIGNAAGRYGSGLSGNVGIGQDALKGTSNNNGDYNVGIGWQSGLSIEDGAQNVFIGYRAAEDITTGNYNVVIGKKSGFLLTTGTNNITIGPDAGNGVSTGNRNIAIGYSSSFSGDVSDQLIIGSGSLATISASLATGDIIFASTASAEYLSTTAGNISSISASYALTASHALNAGSSFPFTGDAQITGSLIVSSSATSQSLSVVGSGSTVFDVVGSVGTLFSVDDDLTGTLFTANDISGLPVLQASASGEVYIGKSPQSLYTTAIISSNTANVTQSIYGLSTSSYAGAFFEYTAFSGSHDARAGSIMAIWSGSSVNFTETTTTDFGDTSNLIMQVAISQSQAQIQSYSTTAGYKIKTIVKAI